MSQDFLDLRIPEFRVEEATVKQAMQELNKWGVQAGLELAEKGERNDRRITVALENASIREVLNAIVNADGRFVWEKYVDISTYSHKLFVNVMPIGASRSADNLLNMRLKTVRIQQPMFPESIVATVSTLIPEVRKRLYGNAGVANGLGEVVDAPVKVKTVLDCENLTLREVLNEVALRTTGFGWVYDPSAHGREHEQQLFGVLRADPMPYEVR